MKLKRSKVTATLVLAGSALVSTAQVHVPAPKPAPSREFITKTYVRPTGVQRWQASEARKREILQRLDAIRKTIRIKAETYQLDKNTRITGITANQKLNIHSMKLMSRIADCKNVKNI